MGDAHHQHPAEYFEPVEYRSSSRTSALSVVGKRKNEYNDLANVDFNPTQKNWVIDGLAGKNHGDPRWVGLEITRKITLTVDMV